MSIQIGDIIIRKLQDGDAEQKRYRVVGNTPHFHVCQEIGGGEYYECFQRDDVGKEVFKV